jgi:serine/threonine protein phosphatase PrpC
MTASFTPQYSARTDVGRMREINEDYVFAGALDSSSEAGAAPERHLLVVADGVGGLERGEWASELAVAVLTAQLPAHLAGADPGAALRLSMQVANERIWREEDTRAGSSPGPAATTMVAVVIEGSRLWWANVGDSRAYLVSKSQVQRLTRDHSWIEEQVRGGWLTPEQARKSERRNIITRGIGHQSVVEVDTGGPLDLHADDVVLLCSDGLHGVLSDEEIAQAVRDYPPVEATELLIELCNQRGGPDNISVIVCGFVPRSTDSESHGNADAGVRGTYAS